jgi:hypothetical protein
MPEVDLTIIANNQQHLKSVLESKKAEEEFFAAHAKGANNFTEGTKQMESSFEEMTKKNQQNLNNSSKAYQEQVGFIEDITNSIKEWEAAKIKSTNPKDIEKYNRKIAEARRELKEYDKMGLKVEATTNKVNAATKKSTHTFESMRTTWYKAVFAIGAVVGAFIGLTSIMKLSEKGTEFLERKTAGLKASFGLLAGSILHLNNSYEDNEKKATKWGQITKVVLGVITSPALLFKKYRDNLSQVTEGMDKAAVAAEKYATIAEKLKDEERYLIVSRAESNKKIAEAKMLYEDETLSITERIAGLKKSLEIEQETADAEVENQRQVVANIEEQNALLKQSGMFKDADNDRYAAAVAKRIELETASFIKRRKLQSTLNAAELELNREKNEKLKQQHEEFSKLIEDLNKRYQEAQLEGLTGKARINAEEDFALLELANFKETLEEKGELTKEYLTMIEFIETSIAKRGVIERKKIDNEEKINLVSSKRELLNVLLQNSEDEIDLTRATEEEKIELKISAYEHTIDALTKLGDAESLVMAENLKKAIRFMKKDLEDIQADKKFTIWTFLGIDENTKEGQKQIEGIKAFTELSIDSIGQILDAEAQLAAQRRQNAENRLDELENQLDEELDLQEQGLANNVNAVKKEIETTKAEKEKAIEQEKEIQKQKMAMDTLAQVSSLITASTKIFEATAGILPPFGQILAIAAIGTMFAYMTATKIKAAQASKMEQGGFIDQYGIVQGKRHSDGGEPLGKHVEVEQGEGVGVFNRNATQYYGGMLPKWVQSINNRNFPKFDIRPELKANQVFDLKTSSMNNKLDSINTEIRNLSYNILNQYQINHKQGVRVEKQGNRTRIIHEK